MKRRYTSVSRKTTTSGLKKNEEYFVFKNHPTKKNCFFSRNVDDGSVTRTTTDVVVEDDDDKEDSLPCNKENDRYSTNQSNPRIDCVVVKQKQHFGDKPQQQTFHKEDKHVEKEDVNENIKSLLTGHMFAMSELEEEYLPQSNYLEWQPHINATMRSILVDWMIQVSQEYLLQRETLHYAINYLDRYLSKCHAIVRNELQLIGVTSLFLASKIEEIYPPKATQFALTTDGAFTSSEICQKEKEILHVLNWRIVPPTSHTWLNWFIYQNCIEPKETSSGMMHMSENGRCLYKKTMHILDLSLYEYCALSFSPCILAAAALTVVEPSATSSFDLLDQVDTFQFHICLQWLEFTKKIPFLDQPHPWIKKIAQDTPVENYHSMQSHDLRFWPFMNQVIQSNQDQIDESSDHSSTFTASNKTKIHSTKDHENEKDEIFLESYEVM